MSDEAIETENNSSPGSRLKIAREGLGISQKSLADDLYLPRNYIIWIEEGAYEKLPSMVFCRGYIRAYAKLVSENGEELIELLDNIYGSQNVKTTLMPVSKIDEQVKVGDPVMKWSSLLFILILCAAVFWWWKTQYGLNTPFFSSQDPIAVETADGNELVLPSLDNDTAIETSNDQLSVENSTQLAGTESQLLVATANVNQTSGVDSSSINNGNGIELSLSVVDEERESQELAELEKVVKELEPEVAPLSVVTSEKTVQESTGVQLLQIAFNNECWITIKDSRGKTLLNGIKKSGQKISLSGDAPLSVSIGRVDSVSKITYGGKTINLSALSRNNIANFKLPL
jgi:cytoskeleton protein RodZ